MRGRLALLPFWLLVLAVPALADLSPEITRALEESQHVYVASTRKDGSLGRPAEIWFLFHDGAVYVASPPSTWRARRIRAGRPEAAIAVGRADGPSFRATGEIVKDPAIEKRLMETFARKYPDRWPGYEQKFREQFADGSRVLIRYRPTAGK